MICPMHLTIEMRKPGTTAWELVGNFSVSDAEIGVIRGVLEGDGPYELLHKIKNPLIFDVLNVVRAEARQARVQVHSDN